VRVGLLGGTFDPIHFGHLLLAEGAREALSLDEVIWIPARQPPHKPQPPNASAEDRCRMVELAIGDHPQFRLSRIEIDRSGPSYTIDTVRQLQASLSHKIRQWYLLLGAETAAGLPGWKEGEQLMGLVRCVAIPRPGFEVPQIPPQVEWLPVRTLEVSASQIRQRVRENRSIRYLVPEPVRQFIAEKGLYR
jgi:nicotinate-nucleotide adenylyltransferase